MGIDQVLIYFTSKIEVKILLLCQIQFTTLAMTNEVVYPVVICHYAVPTSF